MKAWDLFVRINHWLVALLFLSSYFLLDGGGELHEWAGYLIALLIAMRLVWAFVGPSSARLSHFVPSFDKLFRHIQLLKQRQWLRAEQGHISHNPLGALMVIFLWMMLLVCAATGYMQELDAFWGVEWVQELHEISAKAILAAVLIHVTAVVLTQKLSGEKLIQAMLWRK